MIKVSVIIPVYNSEKYLKECLDSVCSQTLGSNLEIICVDDASTDSSLELLEEYQKIDNRIKIISQKINEGQANARNIGIDNARGKYIYFMDSDDVLKQDSALLQLFNTAEIDQVEGVFFAADLILEYEDRNFIGDFRSDVMGTIDEGVYSGKEFLNSMMCLHAFPAVVWRQFWRRDFLDDIKLRFDKLCSPHEDLLFSFEAFMRVKRIKQIKEVLYSYRIRKDSCTSGSFSKKQLSAYTRCYYEAIAFIRKYGIIKDSYRVTNSYLAYILRTIKKHVVETIKRGESIDWSSDFGDEGYWIKKLVMADFPELERMLTYEEYCCITHTDRLFLYGAGKVCESVIKMLDVFKISDYEIVVSDKKEEKKRNILKLFSVDEKREQMNGSTIILALMNKAEKAKIKDQLAGINVSQWIDITE